MKGRLAAMMVVGAAVALSLDMLSPVGNRAAAQIDISGTWNFTLSSGITCTAVITQSGNALSETYSCSHGDFGSATGTIDTATGQATVTGSGQFGTFTSTGVASSDGNFMSGTITGPVPATFTATRKGVGGIAELPEVDAAPLEAPEASGPGAGVVAGIAGAVAAGAVGLSGAAWYARKRRRS